MLSPSPSVNSPEILQEPLKKIKIFSLFRPGIKTKKTLHSAINKKKIDAQNEMLKKTIFPEIKKLYGVKKGCEMF